MALNLFKDTGTPLQHQKFTLRELIQKSLSKLDDDVFTRVRVIPINGIELEALRFSHSFARMNRELQLSLARIRRIETPYLTQVYRFGLLEAFDHMYRYAALMDRFEGKDASNILQSYTDIIPRRPTEQELLATAQNWVRQLVLGQSNAQREAA